MYTIVDLCVICLTNDKNLKSILSQGSDGVVVKKKLLFFLCELENIKTEASEHICLPCLKTLDHVYNFKQLCLKNIAKFNRYVNTFQNTEDSCRNLQVKLININNLKDKTAKCENEHSEHTSENLNLDTVTVKREYNDDYNGIEYDVQQRQEIEVDEQILRNQTNVMKEEHEDVFEIENKTQTDNLIIDQRQQMFVDDEIEYEFADEIVKEEPEESFNNIDIKSELRCEAEENLQREATVYKPTLNFSSQRSKEKSHKYSIQTGEKCGVCGKACNDPNNLLLHKRMHTGDKSYKCKVCEKTCFNSSDFKNHKPTNISKHPYECNICGKKLVSKANLSRHKVTHIVKKQYDCLVCQKAFTSASALAKHKLIHTIHMSYKCDACGKSFSSKTNLKRHEVTHIDKNKYKCLVCNEVFISGNALIKHNLGHIGDKTYECATCGKRFQSTTSLSRHKLTHIDKKQHVCIVCNKAFISASALVKHNFIHTDKPYKCAACDKTYTSRNSLRRHEVTHKSDRL